LSIGVYLPSQKGELSDGVMATLRFLVPSF
jgi:hypothetical protein